MKQLVALAIVLGLFISGCAKRPQSVETSAPAPTGAVARTPEPAPRGAPTTPEVTTPGTRPGAPELQPPMPSPPRPAPAVPPSVVAPQAPPSAQPPAVARPAGPVAAAEFREVVALKDIHFDFDKYDIRPDAARVLDANVDWMKSNPDATILVEGHCDERGTNDYNLALGDRRARATMNYLVARGVAASRIRTISYGEERPLCAAHTEACWARNRRAHFLARVN